MKSDIPHNLSELITKLPSSVKLVAVSKNHTPEEILQAYHSGQRRFGENRVQEILAKQTALPSDIEWHFIGHLQTNKVRYIVPFVSLIQSIDGFKVLKEVNKEANRVNRIIDCLLEMHIAEEETKFGFDLGEIRELLESETFRSMQNIRITGLMGMATFTSDTARVRKEFKMLYESFQLIRSEYFAADKDFCEISMGMSDDFHIAVEEGSTLVRIGTAIFGSRVKTG